MSRRPLNAQAVRGSWLGLGGGAGGLCPGLQHWRPRQEGQGRLWLPRALHPARLRYQDSFAARVMRNQSTFICEIDSYILNLISLFLMQPYLICLSVLSGITQYSNCIIVFQRSKTILNV